LELTRSGSCRDVKRVRAWLKRNRSCNPPGDVDGHRRAMGVHFPFGVGVSHAISRCMDPKTATLSQTFHDSVLSRPPLAYRV
jgi:hypothetical protein